MSNIWWAAPFAISSSGNVCAPSISSSGLFFPGICLRNWFCFATPSTQCIACFLTVFSNKKTWHADAKKIMKKTASNGKPCLAFHELPSLSIHQVVQYIREKSFGQQICFHFSSLVLFGSPSTSSHTSLPKITFNRLLCAVSGKAPFHGECLVCVFHQVLNALNVLCFHVVCCWCLALWAPWASFGRPKFLVMKNRLEVDDFWRERLREFIQGIPFFLGFCSASVLGIFALYVRQIVWFEANCLVNWGRKPEGFHGEILVPALGPCNNNKVPKGNLAWCKFLNLNQVYCQLFVFKGLAVFPWQRGECGDETMFQIVFIDVWNRLNMENPAVADLPSHFQLTWGIIILRRNKYMISRFYLFHRQSPLLLRIT